MSTLLFLSWLISAIISAGIIFAYFDGTYGKYGLSYKHRLSMSLVYGSLAGVAGPIGIAMSFLLSNFCKHGIRWTPKKEKL